jgi:hypothetical protein
MARSAATPVLLALMFAPSCKREEKTAPPAPATSAPLAADQAGPAPTPVPGAAPAATLTPELAIETAGKWLAALEKGDAAALAAASATPFKLYHTGIEDHFACGAMEEQKDAAALQKTATCLAGHAGLKSALAGATVQPTVAKPPPDAVRTPKFVAGWQADHVFIFFQLQKNQQPDPDAEVTHSLDGLLAVRLADGKPVVDGASLDYAAIAEEGD